MVRAIALVVLAAMLLGPVAGCGGDAVTEPASFEPAPTKPAKRQHSG